MNVYDTLKSMHTNRSSKNSARKDKDSQKWENQSETLSVLLKLYDDTCKPCRTKIEDVNNLICISRIKSDWKKRYIQTVNSRTELEYAAHNAANYLESLVNKLCETMSEIDSNKDQAKDFAKSCFLYLNKVHEGTCIGEAGKVILNLFNQGKLCSHSMDVIMAKAEEISKEKKIPFAHKLNENQKKAIDFMVEEKEQRVSPIIHHLQTYKNLKEHMGTWVPLLEALVEENSLKAQKIINSMP